MDGILNIEVVSEKEIVYIISVYVLQVKLDNETKRQFWNSLDEMR